MILSVVLNHTGSFSMLLLSLFVNCTLRTAGCLMSEALMKLQKVLLFSLKGVNNYEVQAVKLNESLYKTEEVKNMFLSCFIWHVFSSSFSIMDIEKNLVLPHAVLLKLILHNTVCGLLPATL